MAEGQEESIDIDPPSFTTVERKRKGRDSPSKSEDKNEEKKAKVYPSSLEEYLDQYENNNKFSVLNKSGRSNDNDDDTHPFISASASVSADSIESETSVTKTTVDNLSDSQNELLNHTSQVSEIENKDQNKKDDIKYHKNKSTKQNTKQNQNNSPVANQKSNNKTKQQNHRSNILLEDNQKLQTKREDFPVIITDTGKGPATLNGLGLKLRTLTIERQFGPVQSIQTTKNGSVIIGCTSVKQQNNIAKSKQLANIPITAKIPVPWTEGVVKGIDIDDSINPNDITVIIDNKKIQGKVISVSRLNLKDGEKSRALKIRFSLEILPSQVIIHRNIVRIEPFVAPTIRCTHCNKFGHCKKTM